MKHLLRDCWRTAFLVALAVLAGPAQGALTLSLSVDRPKVPADGLSQATLTATVRDSGSLTSQNLIVRFHATQGTLESVSGATPPGTFLEVPVQAGIAKCLLRSTTFDTTSIVTAVLAGVKGSPTDQLELVFGLQAGPDKTFDNIIRVKGDYLWYGPEPAVQIMEVIGNAQVSYQGVEVRANRIQIDLQEYLLLAKDLYKGVTVATSPPPYEDKDLLDSAAPPYKGEALAMDLRSQNGALYSGELGETIYFAGRSLARQPDRPPSPGLYDLFELDDVKIWITARSAAVYPYEKIRFDRARFYVNGSKVFSMPYYFEGLGYNAQLGPALTQVVNYSTQDGLIVDFPYYFDVGDLHTNEFRLTRGIRTGLFGRTTGFQLSYAHHGDLPGDRGEYDFVVDDLLGSFGVQYNRQQRFGRYTFGTVSLAWPRHENFYSNATLYTPAGPGNVSMNVNADYLRGFGAFDDGINVGSNAVWQSHPVALGPLDSSLSGSVGLGYSRTITGQEFWRQSGALSLTKNPWRIGASGSLQPYAGLRLQNTVDGAQEVAFTFNTTYRQQIGQSMSLSAGYTFDTAWNSQFSLPDRHMLTANWQLYAENSWTGYAYGTYNLVDDSVSASALLDYMFIRNWGVAGQTLYQSSPVGSFSESELWVYRVLGARELRLRYNLERGKLFVEIDNSF